MTKDSIGKLTLTSGLSASAVVLSLAGHIAANAEEITYDGTRPGVLQTDPSGKSNPFKSLYSTNSQSGNTLKIGSETAGEKVEWATTGTANAPYVIYGGVDIRPNTKKDTDPVEEGADISNNNVELSNVRYDWSGKNSVGGGLSIDGSNANGGGFGGGSIFGGVSVGASAMQSGGAFGGGKGGDISGNKVTLQNVEIIGSNSGDGLAGNTGGIVNGALSGGIGGQGGGSVFGGLSVDGSGSIGAGRFSGVGGKVHHNDVTLKNVVLTGGSGGKGGENNNGSIAGWLGGMGGIRFWRI
ncbi:hypothetical protein [uncultured Bartonella sp.]|uniref:hypothetical protein n=1 Tax=uncultured Bartonella sp. TaxID=104108 RepID=UPI002617610C|nr:hypothetical protein [uncultured Bartonella sp.]